MPPQGDQVSAFRIACIEQRALISEVVHIKDCKYCLTVRIPSVNIYPVSLALYQRCPMAVKESIAVSAEKKGSSGKVLKISLIFITPAARSVKVQLGSIPVKKCHRYFAVQYIFSDIGDTENGKVGFDQFVQVKFRTEEQCIMHSCRDYSGHIFHIGHSLRVHNNAITHGINCLLQM